MLTPQFHAPKLAKAIGLDTNLYLKREDLHPYGSHKGRSIPIMIEYYVKQGWRDFVISSSGNAGLAAIYSVKAYNKKHAQKKISLTVFVGEKIDGKKLSMLQSVIASPQGEAIPKQKGNLNLSGSPRLANTRLAMTIQQVANPKQQAFLLDKTKKAKNLRQSTNDLALLGYYKLAKELSKINNLSAVFVPTSSGTTAQGFYEGFRKLGIKPQIHIVQTDYCHPMIGSVIASETKQSRRTKVALIQRDCFVVASAPPRNDKNVSLANAIVDKIAHRKKEILKILKTSHGAGWVASDKEIKEVVKLMKKSENLKISANSALSIVGLKQAIKAKWKFKGAIVCLITGN